MAAYCRVSTDQEEQLSSYENQVNYYTNYMSAPDRSGKRHLTIMMANQGNMRQMRYARSWIRRSLAGKEAVIIVSQKKDLVHSGAGSERERKKQRLSTNWTKMAS